MTIGRTYYDFFQRTIGERHVFLQGGRRSGKTFATFQWLAAIGGMQGNTTIVVLCYQLPQLRSTIDDFERVTGAAVVCSTTDGYTSVTPGVRWLFRHCDDKSKAQGTQADYLFVNEAVNFPFEKGIIETYSYGIREQIIYNFNPTKSWRYGDDRINERNLLQTTWRDNERNLTEEQKEEFEQLRIRAQRPNATNYDRYQYAVYYCGNFAMMVGSVFGAIGRCSVEDYEQLPAQECFGIDFGFATDGDPTTLMGVKVHERKVYVRQYIYERGLTSDEDLCRRCYDLGMNEYTTISGDYGGMGASRMQTLRTADNGRWSGSIAYGLNIINALKGNSVLDSLGAMLSLDGIVVCEGSEEARNEFEAYELDEHGKPRGADHAIDAARYAFAYSRYMGY